MKIPRIFVSMGTPYNSRTRDFRDRLEDFLRNECHVDPRIIGINEYPSGNPLSKIREVMSSCDGVIVVAYERKYLDKGIEKRNSDNPLNIEQKIYTTPWNHIESAMAYTLNKPLYIICEKGLAEEGLIESKIDWYVQYVEMEKSALSRQEVDLSIREWIKSRVIANSKNSILNFRILNDNSKISDITIKEIIAIIAFGSAAFGAGIAFSRYFPSLLH